MTCTGNTCRSVMAEYTFKEMAKDSLFNLFEILKVYRE
ncbi:hypothetical protein KJ849_00525 [bacterium]|nr:hypothetical protein [bacterium]